MDGLVSGPMPRTPSKRKKPGRPAAHAAAGEAPSVAQRVGDLAWAGQHAQAIEAATAALAKSSLSVASRLDLLDLRAGSFISQGELEHSATNAGTMVEL